MDPFTIAAILGTAAPIAGDLVGRATSSGDDAEAKRLEQLAMEVFGEVTPYTLQKVEAAMQGRSELSDVTPDSRYSNVEDEVLAELMDLSRSGGLSAMDRANLDATQADAASFSRGVTQAGEKSAMRRGMYGSNAQMLNQLSGQQGAINRAYKGATDTAAMGADRALRAKEAAGRYASSLAGNSYDRRANAASAQDRINAFNTSNRNDAAVFNARQADVKFGNDMQLAGAKTGAYRYGANAAHGRADDARQQARDYGSAVGKGARAFGRHSIGSSNPFGYEQDEEEDE